MKLDKDLEWTLLEQNLALTEFSGYQLMMMLYQM